jgi:micrococcal nuclease
VVSIADGDTLTVRQQGQTQKVRLACIDAPELTIQPDGLRAKQHLQRLLPIGAAITLRPVEQDRYGRLVAEVYHGSRSANLAMVQSGQAVIYPQYFANCRATQTQYRQAQAQAQQKKLGLWAQAKPVMPWETRQTSQGRRPTSPVKPPSSACHPAYPDLCLPVNGPDLDCRDIPQRSFRVLPPDPHHLDRDRDGIGCEG